VYLSLIESCTTRGSDPRGFVENLSHLTVADLPEEVVAELARSQDSAFNLRDSARTDYLARAKICSKLIKYPNVEDYTVGTSLDISTGEPK
jgi:hypothetical protein